LVAAIGEPFGERPDWTASFVEQVSIFPAIVFASSLQSGSFQQRSPEHGFDMVVVGGWRSHSA
jgi:hypothetical protein